MDTDPCKAGRHSGHLLAKGRGHTRTRGHHGAGTLRGKTGEWETEDTCKNTTKFTVFSGKLKVEDFFTDKTVTLGAGDVYVAKKKRH